MNYLDLTNRVLDRLREERATESTLDSNPYFRSIGAHINDAKEQVENAWQWTQLRQVDEIPVALTTVALPDSLDNNYVIQRILVKETGCWLRWVSDDRMAYWKSNAANTAIPEGSPGYYATGYPVPESNANNNAGTTGLQTIEIYPKPDQAYTLEVTSWHNQDPLTAATDVLKVPSLPVYSLATALASRERGETGAINTGELFAIAQSNLSDAIAYDSARMPEELDWYASHMNYNTNVKTA